MKLSEKYCKIILCADDYAIAPGVSRAIVELIEAGRISATSCMTISPYWPELASALSGFEDKADIGLHFTLTHQKPLGVIPHTAPDGNLPPPGKLFYMSMTRRLDLDEVRDELARQTDAFEKHLGRPPAYIDGHHYVQQFPGIRRIVADFIEARYPERKPYLRSCWTPVGVVLRRRISVVRSLLFNTSGAALKRLAASRDIPVITNFSGLYDLSGGTPFSELFEKFLIGLEENSLIVCHPGWVDNELVAADGLTSQREVEYTYLAGDEFPEALERAKVRLGKFS